MGDVPLHLKIAAGLATGAIGITVASPTDLVKVRRGGTLGVILTAGFVARETNQRSNPGATCCADCYVHVALPLRLPAALCARSEPRRAPPRGPPGGAETRAPLRRAARAPRRAGAHAV